MTLDILTGLIKVVSILKFCFNISPSPTIFTTVYVDPNQSTTSPTLILSKLFYFNINIHIY